MRVTEALLRQNYQNRNKPKFDEDDEPTQTYNHEKKKWQALNQNRSAFDSVMEQGINSAESVFDRKAVFRTNNGR